MSWADEAREKAERLDIPYRKALLWTEPYDFEERKGRLKSFPEYGVVELDIGGIIAVEDANG